MSLESASASDRSSNNGEQGNASEIDNSTDYYNYDDDDVWSYYETTYSEDERIEKCLKEKREKEKEEARQTELERGKEFQEYYENNKDKENSIFNLKGINFIRFTSKRIKFSFQPCRVARLVCKRVMFFISLRYRKGSWLIKRDSIPANYKRRIYSLFYTNGSFRFDDESIPYGIVEIWRILKTWAKSEDQFRKLKYQRYKAGEDVYIDTDDEDLFLSDTEIEELHRKREIIWNRMLPPDSEVPSRLRTRRQTRHERSVLSSTSESLDF
ncbi:hypothetical protein ILUMI_02336 [Ignelater luminosus]|uniref:Uncharacterized protein n=1 Tax=Ignelater luminosus TaxID=2038154 RepID=A0A8K0GN97_IGNLU|nr:hypothetical protein ILUMI_02336 [Ignelater luminosus]